MGTIHRRSLRPGAGAPVVALGVVLCVAFGADAQVRERSGKEVVDSLCISCHGTGAGGAPRIGDAKAWSARTSRGLTALGKSAAAGVRQMPAHGGNPDLTDIELERAITYMVNQSGGHWTEPAGRVPAVRTGKSIVETQCIRCHGTGVGGAPRIGDRAAWLPRAKEGLDAVVRSAIHGHGAMPPRGGMADLTDPEIRSAVVYMVNAGTGAEK